MEVTHRDSHYQFLSTLKQRLPSPPLSLPFFLALSLLLPSFLIVPLPLLFFLFHLSLPPLLPLFFLLFFFILPLPPPFFSVTALHFEGATSGTIQNMRKTCLSISEPHQLWVVSTTCLWWHEDSRKDCHGGRGRASEHQECFSTAGKAKVSLTLGGILCSSWRHVGVPHWSWTWNKIVPFCQELTDKAVERIPC